MSLAPLQWLLLSVCLYGAGALLSLLLARLENLAIGTSSVFGMAGAACGLAASLPVLQTGTVERFLMDGPFEFAHFAVRLDPLAALLLLAISALTLLASLYGWSYVREYRGRGVGAMGFFANAFIASMTALVAMDNAFYFLILFEAMSLASYFLVIFEQDEDAVDAGFLYFLIAHTGSVLILIAFFLLYAQSGSLDFDSFRALGLDGPLASVVFLLALFGFGAKAGMVPLHGWLPRAHPAAPSHASALMSGVMVKIGVFGIIKVGVDILGAHTAWWGLLVLAIGGVSAVLGVLYALAEQDLKRLLAYSTVENVGIILLGVGAGMLGLAAPQPLLAALGFLAAGYHLLNHALFKGLLFMGAGSILYRAHSKDMEQLGGLAARMPWTALSFLAGSLAICALPPFNGFVSEWFTYQALFAVSQDAGFALRLAGPLAMVMLALTGALAAMAFVKAYGMCFSSAPRSRHAAEATEAPLPMRAAMLLAALALLLLGVGASAVSPLMANVAASLTHAAPASVTEGLAIHPGLHAKTMVSMPILALLLISLPLCVLLALSILRGARLARRQQGDAWACGYAQEASMSVGPQGLTQPVAHMFAPLYRLRSQLSPSSKLEAALERTIAGATRAEPVWDQRLVLPAARWVDRLAACIRVLQHGDFRLYCLYVVVALVALLLIVAR
ncbi:hydrogenase 4 subunit B [Chromobacterium sinusclupearum]|uniref:Hydrogenase 4 subunit B n=1 Tax=Chromobacterium sinusclupearum TaxID=2077146 RepID=A0A2K4MML1_9NEIS|nr:hydrogenase 4 subunit B [Chromobacterium sinusclupearum]POA98239.1 hydrogenase 4 subunit B [Chromobacterium sinusclupearum]